MLYRDAALVDPRSTAPCAASRDDAEGLQRVQRPVSPRPRGLDRHLVVRDRSRPGRGRATGSSASISWRPGAHEPGRPPNGAALAGGRSRAFRSTWLAGCLPWRSRLRFGLGIHLHLHSFFQSRHSGRYLGFTKRAGQARGQARAGGEPAVDDSRLALESIAAANGNRTTTSTRTRLRSSSTRSSSSKAILQQSGAATIWDLGANTGYFSFLAHDLGLRVVSFESDPACVERTYVEAKAKGATRLLPLVQDLANPTPSFGWENARASLDLRTRPAGPGAGTGPDSPSRTGGEPAA